MALSFVATLSIHAARSAGQTWQFSSANLCPSAFSAMGFLRVLPSARSIRVKRSKVREERAVSEPEEDFATMFEASTQAKRIERGQTIEGTVVAIGPESALVDVGGKSEAVIDIDELKNADGDVEVAVGDRIHATVVSTVRGLTLSRRLALGAASARQIEDAFRAGLPVQGKVEGSVKGGYEVRIAASAPSVRSPRSTSSATPIRRSTRDVSTSFASSTTRTVARTSSSRAVHCSKSSRRRRPPTCGGPSSKAR